MVKSVVIGASRDAIHTIKKAKEQGIYVIALDGNPKAEGFAYADEAIEVDISDRDKVCDIIKEIAPDFTITVPIGRYLSTTGYVNEKFGLKGIKYNATELSVDKYLFHKCLQENGLRSIGLKLVNKNTDRTELVITYPAIMKPRFGSGSRDVFYIENDSDLEAAYRAALEIEEDFVLEEMVQGIEYGVDGAVIDGKLEITLLRKKQVTPLPVRQAIGYIAVVKKGNEIIYHRIQEKLHKAVNILGYQNCLIHVDLILQDNQIFIIEMSPRPSGHNLHNVFVPVSTGIDLAEEYIKFMLEKEHKFLPDNICCMQIRFFDFENVVIKGIPKEEELRNSGRCNLVQWNCNIKIGDIMNKVVNGHSIMGRGFFIVEGDNEEDLIKQSEWILAQFKREEV